MSYGGSSGSTSAKVSNLGDSALSNPGNGDVLAYNSSTQKWSNLAGKVTATVDGTAVNTLALSSSVSAADVGAMPAPSGTPTVGQVPVVSATSPLAFTWGSGGSGGSGSSGSGNASTTIIRPEAYGAKADGFFLSELSISAGSTSVTSSNAPFTSTAVDAGKVIYWRVGAGSYEKHTIVSVQSSTQATINSAASSAPNVNSGPNGCGVIGTDNTSALNQAYAAAQAPSIAALNNASPHDGFWRQTNTPGLQVRLQAGIYLTRPLTTMTGWNVVTVGEGMYNTYMACCEAGNIFTLATFNQNASYAYPSTVLNWTFRDIYFTNPCLSNGDSNNNRTNIAIQDNGNGSVTTENCYFRGFKYGYASTYGGDFSRMWGCYFNACDVGTYFGPGAQQLEIGNCDWSNCVEGLVTEGVQNVHIGSNCHFQDPYTSAYTISGPSNTTRFGVAANIGGGAWYAGSIIVDGSAWFESNSGNNGVVCPRMIWVNGDGPYGVGVSGIVIRDAHFISGGTQQSGGTAAFLELNTNYVVDRPVMLDNVDVGGSFINYMVNCTGNASNPTPLLRDCSFDESKIGYCRNSNAYRYIKRNGQMHGFTSV